MTTDISAPPVVFWARGIEPDVQLTVFSRRFHVHKTVLQLHSAFFHKFLDPPNGQPVPARASKQFPCEWVTKVEEDGTWLLGSIEDTHIPVGDLANFKGDQAEQETTFEKLLDAFYNKPYCLTTYHELENITNLADYYCALPVLSSSIPAVLYRSPELISEMQEMATEFLQLAVKLRSDLLFRDSLILSLGPWCNPKYHALEDEKLKLFTDNVYSRLCAKLVYIQGQILLLQNNSKEFTLYCNGIIPSVVESIGNDPEEPEDVSEVFSWPRYILKISNYTFKSKRKSLEQLFLRSSCQSLLSNNLVLNPNKGNSGEGFFEEYFLGVDIEDRDLPWDTTQTDW